MRSASLNTSDGVSATSDSPLAVVAWSRPRASKSNGQEHRKAESCVEWRDDPLCNGCVWSPSIPTSSTQHVTSRRDYGRYRDMLSTCRVVYRQSCPTVGLQWPHRSSGQTLILHEASQIYYPTQIEDYGRDQAPDSAGLGTHQLYSCVTAMSSPDKICLPCAASADSYQVFRGL